MSRGVVAQELQQRLLELMVDPAPMSPAISTHSFARRRASGEGGEGSGDTAAVGLCVGASFQTDALSAASALAVASFVLNSQSR